MNSPYGTRHILTRADQIEINNQWRAVQRAINEYWRGKCGHPTSNLTTWGAGTDQPRVRCKECERERGSRVRAARKKTA